MAKYVELPPLESLEEEMESRAENPRNDATIVPDQLKDLVRIKDEVAVVLGDTHFPYEDKEAMEFFYAWLGDNRENVSRIFLNGDIIDSPQLSKFIKDPSDKDANIMTELSACKNFFERLREITDCPIYYIPGNHCLRLDKYLKTKAPELYEVVQLPELLEMDKYNVTYVPAKKDAFVQYGRTLIGHYDKVSKHSAYTAKALAEDFPGYNIVQNHTHRRGLFCKKGVWAVENSCLADEKQADYVPGTPNWQKGWMIIKTDEDGDQQPEFVIISNGRLKWRDEIYE
jgi:predicted phosphodiesterase